MKQGDIYVHYLGGFYEFLCIAEDENDKEDLVIFKRKDGKFLARKYSVFFEKIKFGNETIDRYRKI